MAKEKFKYDFLEIEGKNEMYNFFNSLEKNEVAKIFSYIYKLIEILDLGIIPKKSFSKHIGNGLFELKVPLKNKTSRIFYFFLSNSMVFFVSGFIKKTNKIPKSEIEKAKKLMLQFMESKND